MSSLFRKPRPAALSLMATAAVLLAGRCGGGGWPLGYYDQAEGRQWERIEVPGATCGNGTPYAFFFSASSRPAEGNDRLTVFFQGGGSTHLTPAGYLDTGIVSLEKLDQRLNAPANFGGRNRIFMDRHPENDLFIGPGHWAFIPYCTQDVHTGRRTGEVVYDFTNGPGQLRLEVEGLLNAGSSAAAIEADHPGLVIAALHESPPGTFHVDDLQVNIAHRGALNVEATFQLLVDRVRQENPLFHQNAKVLVSGGSAGGFGAWHSFRFFGDLLDAFPGTQLTLAPLGGSPTNRVWDDLAGDLVMDAQKVAEFEGRVAWWQTLQPCEVAGGAFSPSGTEQCGDALDLLDHYRLERYPGRDIRYLVMFNKEDPVRISDFVGDPNFDQLLLNFCQTVHRYAQRLHLGREADTTPYMVWQFERQDDGSFQRVHVPEAGTMLTHMLEPNGETQSSPFNLLGILNAVAARTFSGFPIHIEHMPSLVMQPNAPNGAVLADEPYRNEMAACNVPWPL